MSVVPRPPPLPPAPSTIQWSVSLPGSARTHGPGNHIVIMSATDRDLSLPRDTRAAEMFMKTWPDLDRTCATWCGHARRHARIWNPFNGKCMAASIPIARTRSYRRFYARTRAFIMYARHRSMAHAMSSCVWPCPSLRLMASALMRRCLWKRRCSAGARWPIDSSWTQPDHTGNASVQLTWRAAAIDWWPRPLLTGRSVAQQLPRLTDCVLRKTLNLTGRVGGHLKRQHAPWHACARISIDYRR